MNYSIFTACTASHSFTAKYAPLAFGFSLWFVVIGSLGAIRLIQHLALCIHAFVLGFNDGYQNGHLQGQFSPLTCSVDRAPSCPVYFAPVALVVEPVLLEVSTVDEQPVIDLTEKINSMGIDELKNLAKAIGLKISHNIGQAKLRQRLYTHYEIA